LGQKSSQPKVKKEPQAPQPRAAFDPESYLKLRPVWRFSSFDWDGPWGVEACNKARWREHIEQHLASFETMTWAEILRASGGRGEGQGNNHHHLSREKFTGAAQSRLDTLRIFAEELFSLRFSNCCRLYGVRENNCFRIVWFDPYHCKRDGSAAYNWG
jgi:hypothetical protein